MLLTLVIFEVKNAQKSRQVSLVSLTGLIVLQLSQEKYSNIMALLCILFLLSCNEPLPNFSMILLPNPARGHLPDPK